VAPPRPSAQPPSLPPANPTPPERAVVVPPPADGKPVAPPPTDEEFAKRMIQNVLKEYCAAHEALDPAAVQRLYPKVNMSALLIQLNRSKYKSVQCKFADPEFLALDPAAGTAKVQAEVKRIYEHTAVKDAPQTDEQIAVMTLSRPSLRSPWFIDAVTYRAKPK
jgi:hypothetical protein